MRNIPAELEATSKDVADFRAVSIELESSIRLEGLLFQSLPQDAPNNLRALAYQLPAASLHARRLIEHAKAKLLEIEGSVMKIRSSEFLAKLRVLERKKLQDLRQELRDMKISISAHFSVKSGYGPCFIPDICYANVEKSSLTSVSSFSTKHLALCCPSLSR